MTPDIGEVTFLPSLLQCSSVEVAHFMSVLPIVESSDLIAALPRDIAVVCSRYASVRVIELPFDQPITVPVNQFWHERIHKGSSHVWLRRAVKAMFTN